MSELLLDYSQSNTKVWLKYVSYSINLYILVLNYMSQFVEKWVTPLEIALAESSHTTRRQVEERAY